MRIVLPASLIAICLASAAATAQTDPATRYVSLNPPPGMAATCIANGGYHQEGTRVCVRSAYGPQFATCGRVQNVLNWEMSGVACEGAAPRN